MNGSVPVHINCFSPEIQAKVLQYRSEYNLLPSDFLLVHGNPWNLFIHVVDFAYVEHRIDIQY